jgi:hypothetical protein
VLLRVFAATAKGNRSFIWFLNVLRAPWLTGRKARRFRDPAGACHTCYCKTCATFKLQNLHQISCNFECLRGAAVPELQKLLTRSA